ncbi:unnamed protein product [Calicophoron daubneyi]|uniref:Uncharacterized protein n=1 Tax=Calicophoron daubneyi TaxID=300641 RepID=A0AAV2TNS7_CALDB
MAAYVPIRLESTLLIHPNDSVHCNFHTSTHLSRSPVSVCSSLFPRIPYIIDNQVPLASCRLPFLFWAIVLSPRVNRNFPLALLMSTVFSNCMAQYFFTNLWTMRI